MKKAVSLLMAFMLSFSPVGSYSADKKAHKSSVAVSKHKVSKSQTKRVKSVRTVKQKSPRKLNVSIRKNGARATKNAGYFQRAKQSYFDAYDGSGPLELASSKALVINQLTGETIYAKNTNVVTPIASVTKLMTAMVTLDAHLPMDDILFIGEDDVDYLKGTSSRLAVGSALTRAELLQLALMSSENRAAAALGRNYPGGIHAFITAMNLKAAMLGMKDTHFVDATGLDSSNVSTADDLFKMVNAAHQYPEIRQITTTASQEVQIYGHRYPTNFVNTNALVRSDSNWVIGLSKTGFINEAGRCLVMQAEITGQPVIIVLLDSVGKFTRIGDANRIRKWLEHRQATSVNTFTDTREIESQEHVNG
jgi:D-alanyl-D-alanine endopeptidase (penicillin-binding protein 7)